MRTGKKEMLCECFPSALVLFRLGSPGHNSFPTSNPLLAARGVTMGQMGQVDCGLCWGVLFAKCGVRSVLWQPLG